MKLISILLAIGLMSISCEKMVSRSASQEESNWSIPENQIFDGGPGKDAIPALTNPAFVSADAVDFISEDDLVIGVKYGNVVKAYPHPILDWHEIINDEVENKAIAINYCPLTGTGTGWHRVLNGEVTTFGVSGMLYNSNLILYDRSTDSHWSQMLLESVNGPLKGAIAEAFTVVETSWKTWKTIYPDTDVVSFQTGYKRNYYQYPYGDYRTNHHNIIFSISSNDQRLPAKERVHGIIMNGKAKAYRFADFSDGNLTVIEDHFMGTPLVVVGSQQHNFIVSFQRTLPDGTLLSFSPAQTGEVLNGEAVLQDNEGNQWNMFGHALSGLRSGQRLQPTTSFIGYWFAWGAFYEDLDIYETN